MLPDRYTAGNLARLAREPGLLTGELTQLGTEFDAAVQRRFRRGGGADVMAEEWDNLLILDACRYDMYLERCELEAGTVESRTAAGSESWEFMQRNFAGRQLHDTVYVTANPHAYKLDADVFFATEHLLEDSWDPDLETIRPEVVADASREAHEAYPDKRLIAHFMQPHFPFIGEAGREIDDGGLRIHLDEGEEGATGGGGTQSEGPAERNGKGSGSRTGNGDRTGDGLTVWGKIRYGRVDFETVRRAYYENLDLVLAVVETLLEDLPGRTVITADHGNLLGERLWPIPVRGYGHPPGLSEPALVTVPWHAIPGDARDVVSEPPRDRSDRPDEALVEDRLRSLGYR